MADIRNDPRCQPDAYLVVPRQEYDLVQVIRIDVQTNHGLAGGQLGRVFVQDAWTDETRWLTLPQLELARVIMPAPDADDPRAQADR